jgi:hypothetical protein
MTIATFSIAVGPAQPVVLPTRSTLQPAAAEAWLMHRAAPLFGLGHRQLEWYRIGGGVSERRWNETTGVLCVQRSSLDLVYLRRGRRRST